MEVPRYRPIPGIVEGTLKKVALYITTIFLTFVFLFACYMLISCCQIFFSRIIKEQVLFTLNVLLCPYNILKYTINLLLTTTKVQSIMHLAVATNISEFL